MKTVLSFFFTTFFAANGFAQSSAELTCRAQAKELAMQTYSNCMTQARNQQVDDIRKNYQKELAALKIKYDNKLKKISGGKLEKSSVTTSEAKDLKGLPAKIKTESLQLPAPQQVQQEKALAVSHEEGSDTSNNETTEAESVEVIEMPVQ